MSSRDIARNDSCFCGSGLKYKRCCLGEKLQDAPTPLDGVLTPEQFLQLDPIKYERACVLDRDGQALLPLGRYSDSIRLFNESIDLCPELPFWYNNRALAELFLGDPSAASETCKLVLDSVDHGNVFARCLIVQCAWFLGAEYELESRLIELRELEPPDPSALLKMLETYGKLELHEDVLTLVDGYPKLLERDAWYYSGVAAANTGNMIRAARDFKRAAKGEGILAKRAHYLEGLVRSKRKPPTVGGRYGYSPSAGDLMPPGVWELIVGNLHKVITEYGVDEERGAIRAEHLPAGLGALIACIRCELDFTNYNPEQMVQLASFIGTKAAVDLLQEIASGKFGSDELRLDAMFRLQQLGALQEGDRMPMVIRGEQTEVFIQGMEFDLDAVPDSLPEIDERNMEAAVDAMVDGDLDHAHHVLSALIKQFPEHPVVRQNYAAILGQSGRHEEALAIQKATVESSPEYLPGRTTLMIVLVEAGDVAAAGRMLRDFELPVQVHPDHYAAYHAAQAWVALCEGTHDHDVADQMIARSESISPENHTVKFMRERLDAHVAPAH